MYAPRKALDQTIRDLNRETRFADPTRAGNRDEVHIPPQQEFLGRSYFFLPPHKAGPLHRKICRPPSRRTDWLFGDRLA